MDPVNNDTIEARRKFVEAWNNTMIDIWQEKIFKFHIIDTAFLYRSVMTMPIRADGRLYNITLSQTFAEYGIWQDLGTGREKWIGNPGDIGKKTKKGKDRNFRERRPWFSPKYYASVMNLRDFYAESCGKEFVGLFANLDTEDLRYKTEHYHKKGLS
ncbi:MAG: hypothetical protein K2M56_01000 [Muribaculaceae bacterium]|nr:hypothetical protein [Muribaculaceae bacterium]